MKAVDAYVAQYDGAAEKARLPMHPDMDGGHEAYLMIKVEQEKDMRKFRLEPMVAELGITAGS